jgi:hypothetical protein
MPLFTAVVLVCQLSTTPTAACDENTAIDVISRSAKSELQCMSGWSEIIAGTALKEDLDKGYYVKTVCRRSKRAASAEGE